MAQADYLSAYRWALEFILNPSNKYGNFIDKLPGDHGILTDIDDKGVTFRILSNRRDVQFLSLKPIEVKYDSQVATFAVERVFAEITSVPKPYESVKSWVRGVPVCGGNPTNGEGMTGVGTVGWNFVFNQQTVCMTNHHVVIPQLNGLTGGWVNLNHQPRLGTVSCRPTLDLRPSNPGLGINPVNYFDMALVTYGNANIPLAMPKMRVTSDATMNAFAYPKFLCDPAEVLQNCGPLGQMIPAQRFHYTGLPGNAANPGFHYSQILRGLFHGYIQVTPAHLVWFVDQLAFDHVTEAGDSVRSGWETQPAASPDSKWPAVPSRTRPRDRLGTIVSPIPCTA